MSTFPRIQWKPSFVLLLRIFRVAAFLGTFVVLLESSVGTRHEYLTYPTRRYSRVTREGSRRAHETSESCLPPLNCNRNFNYSDFRLVYKGRSSRTF